MAQYYLVLRKRKKGRDIKADWALLFQPALLSCN